MVDDRDFAPIDAWAKNGTRCIVRRGPEYARAKWKANDTQPGGGMWAYDFGEDQDAWHQIDFEPTHYALIKETDDA